MQTRLVWSGAVLAAVVIGATAWACGGDDATTPPPRDAGNDTTVVPPPDTGADSPVPDTLSCANYCAKVKNNCTGALAQYADEPECVRMCPRLPLGVQGDQGNNSVACRQYHAGNTPAATHCPHAGPYGGGVCGQRCEAFCAVALATCITGDAGPPDAGPLSSNAACMAECALWNATDPSTPSGPTQGNTLACREYHLRAANGSGATSPQVHCPHAFSPADGGADSGFPCN
jgi:hypothetical protein